MNERERQLAIVELKMESLNRESRARGELYRELSEEKLLLERQIRSDHAESVWMELPERVRVLFEAGSDHTDYKIGDHDDSLTLHYNPVSYNNERADRFFIGFDRDRLVDARDLLNKVIGAFRQE